jgi:hypothetical protein
VVAAWREAFMAGDLEFVGLAEMLQKSLQPHLEKLMSGATFAMDFSFPISKVDEEKREVTGIATDESIDSHNEILDYGASKAAFATWQKNIREMHTPSAVGRAVSVVADDAAKSIAITARISRGAEPTWIKVLDGTLRCFSVGGTRLRSEHRSDGVLRTTEWKLTEVSLVDVGANPNTKFAIAKSLSGKAVATDVVALDTEADYLELADAVEKVARQLVARCRPLPSEVTRALRLAGSGIVCDQLAPDDFSQRVGQIAADLVVCAKALKMATQIDDLEKARSASGFILSTLVSRRDLAKAKRPRGDDRVVTLASLQAELARTLVKLRGMQGTEDAIEKLETGAMSLHTVAHVAGAVQKGIFTREELEQMRDTLAAKLQEWQASRRPRTPEYHTIEGQYFIAVERLKSAR